MGLFRKKGHYVPMKPRKPVGTTIQTNIPDDMWRKCPKCELIVYTRELVPFYVCPGCNYGFRLSAQQRLALIVNECSEWGSEKQAQNPLGFPGYDQKLLKVQKSTGQLESVWTGLAMIGKQQTALGIMDSTFIMGSLGSMTGEKITRLFEKATQLALPVVMFTASGGARMQEGIHSLMQMAKISTAVQEHHEAGLFYLVVLTDPTTGGVTASFAMQGDMIIAEPKTIVGFAGRRVIEETIKEQLPEDFQMAETVFQNGFIDQLVERQSLKHTIETLLRLHQQVAGEGVSQCLNQK